jgi:hypothetical protein
MFVHCSGSTIRCRVEGEFIKVPSHLRQPCIWCKCQSHQIVCQKSSPCPPECLASSVVSNQTSRECEQKLFQIHSRSTTDSSRSSALVSKPASKPMFGECVLSSTDSQHFITNYDGGKYRFVNRWRCSHLFTQTCQPSKAAELPVRSETDDTQPEFAVELHNNRRNSSRSSSSPMAYSVSEAGLALLRETHNTSGSELISLPFDELHVRIRSIRIVVDSQLQAQVNNQSVRLPFVQLGVFTVAAGKSGTVIIRVTNGPRIIWSAVKVSVRVPNRLRDVLCGLCGNFNHQIGDDFRSVSGQPLYRSKAFFAAWTVNVQLHRFVSNY